MTWRDEAACWDTDPAVFFDYRRHDEAKAICAGCPVTAECLDYALSMAGITQDGSGVWGGTTAEDRVGLSDGACVQCEKPAHSRGLCSAHYNRWRRAS